MNRTASRRAIVFAAISIVLSITILAGSTYAWFTDRAEVTANRIIAGTLDVEMQYTNNALGGVWEDVENISEDEYAPFFVDADGQPIKWEPGVVSYANFRIANAGDRALKYELSTFAAHFNTALDDAGEDTGKSLTDVVRVGAVTYADESDVKLYDDRDTLLSAVNEWNHLDEVSSEISFFPQEKRTVSRLCFTGRLQARITITTSRTVSFHRTESRCSLTRILLL
ncbi:MAG: hypothetical protein IJ391_04720 [Clostridia bacterium]|nr:hypothetical protein [Clostridia bacterium]